MFNSPIVFVHIPKTAGTSFRVALEKTFPKNLIAYDYGNLEPITSLFIKNFIYQEKNIQKAIDFIEENNIKFLCGHFQANKYLKYFDRQLFCTFLRDPVQRVISEYKHFVRHYNYQESLEVFVRRQDFQNKQSKFLVNFPPENIGFLGITERYKDSLEMFNTKFGLKISYESVNIGRDSLKNQHTEEDENIINLIRELNQEDIVLYQQALQEFEYRYVSWTNNYPKDRTYPQALNIVP